MLNMNSESHDTPNKERYSFTLPPELVNRVDKTRQRLEDNKNVSINRSMIVREALTNWLDHRSEEENLDGDGLAINSYIYDLHDSRVVEELSLVKHDYEEIISSTLNVHFSHHQRFEINICKGSFSKIKVLADRLRGIKELKSLSVNYFQ